MLLQESIKYILSFLFTIKLISKTRTVKTFGFVIVLILMQEGWMNQWGLVEEQGRCVDGKKKRQTAVSTTFQHLCFYSIKSFFSFPFLCRMFLPPCLVFSASLSLFLNKRVTLCWQGKIVFIAAWWKSHRRWDRGKRRWWGLMWDRWADGSATAGV